MYTASQSGMWYIIDKAGRQCGPFATEQLVQLHSTNVIDENTLVIQQGMPRWMQYRDIVANNVIIDSPITPNSQTMPLKKKLYNICVWCLAVLPWIFFLISIANFFRMTTEYLIVEFVVSILLLAGDVFEVKRAGYELGPWVIAAILPPLYLFIRATKTDKKYGYAIVNTVAWMLCISYPILSLFFGLGLLMGML